MKFFKSILTTAILLSTSVHADVAVKKLQQVKTGSTPLYRYHDKQLQDLSGSAYVNGHIYLMSDGGKNSDFPEVRITTLDKLESPAYLFQRQIIQRDIEGATQIGNSIYIASSMSQINEDTDDYRVLSSIRVNDDGHFVSESYTYARDVILSAMKDKFGDDAWLRRVQVSFGKQGGINIEGLSASHNGGNNLVFGFRSPLWDKNFGSPQLDPSLSLKKGLAILIEMSDPIEGSLNKSSVKLLDLKGQGIRGIEYIPAMGGYVIISGGVEKLNEYHLWFYEPKSEEVTKLSQQNDGFSRLCRPESVLNLPEKSTLIILSEESGKACENVEFNYIEYKY